MRFTTTGKTMLLGCALALGTTGCGGDNGVVTPADGGHDSGTITDAGHDSGTGTDAGQDAGTDAGQDAGQDAGPQLPVYLRLAHLAFGTGVGAAHLCAKDPTGTTYNLITSDALLTGDFSHPTVAAPIPYGSITRHVSLSPATLGAFAGQTVYVFRAAEAGAAIVPAGALAFGVCNPTAAPLATAVLGTGTGQINLIPGNSYTVAVVGSAGAELATACGGAACPGAQIVALQDETAPVTGTPTTTRTRVVNADPRYGAAPGFCQYVYGTNPATSSASVTPIGLAPYVGGAAPAYEDAMALSEIIAPLPDGGATAVPYIFAYFAGGAAGTPCAPSGTLPNGGIVPAGTLRNQALINAFNNASAQAMGSAKVRSDLTPTVNTSIFVAPQLLQWIETDITSANVGMPCTVGSSATCQPVGGQCTTPSTSCYWTPIAIPVEDLVP